MEVLGIDVGSTVAKFAILDGEDYTIKALFSSRLYGDPIKCVKDVFKNNELISENMHMAVTGSSRNLIGDIYKVELTKPEIVAHIYGINSYLDKNDVVFEIGGQDSKIIMLHNKVVSNFRMNSNCAAGTGAFIESQARRFGLTVQELDELGMESKEYIDLNAKCATFLESSLINLQRNGKSKEILSATIFNAIANNYIASMSQGINFDEYDNIYFIGGVAKLKSMRQAFERLLKREVIVPDNCEYMGAIGAATFLIKRKDNIKDNNENIKVDQCKGCHNRCILKGIEVNGKVVYVGGLCGRHELNT